MPFIDRIEIRAHSRATEVLERVKEAILNLFPEVTKEIVTITSKTTEGHLQIPIVIVTAILEKRKHCEATFSHIIEKLTLTDRMTLARTLDLRLDEKCVLFLRIDKQAAFLNDVRLSTDPDMISVKIHLRQYPRCEREESIEYLEKYLKNHEGASNAT